MHTGNSHLATVVIICSFRLFRLWISFDALVASTEDGPRLGSCVDTSSAIIRLGRAFVAVCASGICRIWPCLAGNLAI
jgi:hypothetical protein